MTNHTRSTPSDPQGTLRDVCEAAIRELYGPVVPRHAQQRLGSELAAIERLGLEETFLAAADLVQFLNGRGVLCQAVSSICGSFVAYLAGLSNVDPLPLGLLVERYLDPLSRLEEPLTSSTTTI